jgi:LTXXQ motif family protein
MTRGTASAAVLAAGLALGALGLWSDAAAARGGHFGGGFGGGGMRFGGGHFGGGGMRFGGAPFGGMRFGGGGMRFGGPHFGGMRFGGAPFVGAPRPRFGGMPGMRFSPRFGGAPSSGMRFGGMGARGSNSFANGARAQSRPVARPNPGSMAAGQRALAAGRFGSANQRFTGSNGLRAAAAGMAGGRFLHGQTPAAGARAQAFAGHGLAHVQQGGFRHNAFASKLASNAWSFKRHGCCGWFGKVFWPFVVGDVFTAVLWPWPWYEPFWGYGGDWALSNVLWAGPPATPTYYSNTQIYDIYGSGGGRSGSSTASAGGPVANAQTTDKPAATDLAQACAELAPGVADLPIGDIERTVGPTGDQSAALNALKTAWAGGIKLIKTSCSGEVPLTPVRRLDVVEERLEVVLRALQLVSDPLENFHNSLSEAQRRSFDAMTTTAREGNEPAAGLAGRLTTLCSERATSFARLPLDKIVDALRPSEPQRIALDALKSASARASAGLSTSCPAQAPQGLPDRVRAVEQRLAAMISALQTVRPALIDFYRSLSDEQKARFNTMGQSSTQGSNGRAARQVGAN